MGWSIFYVSILVVVVLLVVLRKRTKLLVGRTLFRFHLVSTLLVLAINLTLGQPASAYLVLVVLLPATVVFSFIQDKWFLFKVNWDETFSTIESGLEMILMPYQNENGIFYGTADNTKKSFLIRLDKFPFNCARIKFGAGWSEKKRIVFQRLLKKKFDGVLPRPVIKLK